MVRKSSVKIDREDAVPAFQVCVVERVLDDDASDIDKDIDVVVTFVELPKDAFDRPDRRYRRALRTRCLCPHR